eukprot:9304268-Alexandrium_andersonii.AAC.1
MQYTACKASALQTCCLKPPCQDFSDTVAKLAGQCALVGVDMKPKLHLLYHLANRFDGMLI